MIFLYAYLTFNFFQYIKFIKFDLNNTAMYFLDDKGKRPSIEKAIPNLSFLVKKSSETKVMQSRAIAEFAISSGFQIS